MCGNIMVCSICMVMCGDVRSGILPFLRGNNYVAKVIVTVTF